MTLKEYLKFIFICIIPMVLIATVQSMIISCITETEYIGILLIFLTALIDAFGLIKWIILADDHGWI